MPEQRNLILTIVLSLAILLGFHHFYEVPRQARLHQQMQDAIAAHQFPADGASPTQKPDSPASQVSTLPEAPVQPRERVAVLAETTRRSIDTPRLHGSLSLVGGRLDDLTFTDYYTTVGHKQQVDLLSPSGTDAPYYASFGWVSDDKNLILPDDKTKWNTSSGDLAPNHPVTLTWDNGKGLVFEKTIAIDENYLFTVTERVRNSGSAAVTMFPYTLVSRQGLPLVQQTGVTEGGIGVFDQSVHNFAYKDLDKGGTTSFASTGGWVGFSDKYWLVAAVPNPTENMTGEFVHYKLGGIDRYQADYRGAPQTIAPGAMVETTRRLFAGAKEVNILSDYRDRLGIAHLDLAVDWGWFRFLTKPFFYVIDYLAHLVKNFGIAILLTTVVIRTCLAPLAFNFYHSMNRQKELAPQMAEIKERTGGDKTKMQLEVMELYKKEKVNPVAGCLPLLLQIPIFLSLYKVLSVTIEMRQEPFFGWIQDLSAPDPTNIFTLFGLLHFTPPHALMLGIWPIINGITLMLQQKMNPPPPDPIQARMMMFMPIIFMFVLAKLPAGLVIYYSWSNLLTIAQMAFVRRWYQAKRTRDLAAKAKAEA